MPNQVEPGTIEDAAAEAGESPGAIAAVTQHENLSFHGRPISWVCVGLIIAGFLCGGLSLAFAFWPTFWAGAGLVALGALLAAFTDMFSDWY
jgi:hypothetical protein